MQLIRTIKKSVRKKSSVKTHTIQKPVNRLTTQASRLVSTWQEPPPESISEETLKSVRKFPSAKDYTRQRPVNQPAMQTNRTVSTRHEPPPKGTSEQTIVIIVSNFSSPKNEPVLAEIYAIKLQYNQKLITVRTNNVKHFLRYLAQKVPWF